MDYIKKFDIELEKEYYYAGEKLKGWVVVQNMENIKVRGVRVMLRGKAHVEWKITRGGERRTVKEDQYFIDDKAVVWGKDKHDEGSIPIMHRGEHRFPFEFPLPESALPCSFESKIGTIRYYLRVLIDIPYASPPQGLKYFSIIGPHIDCMDERYLKKEVYLAGDKNIDETKVLTGQYHGTSHRLVWMNSIRPQFRLQSNSEGAVYAVLKGFTDCAIPLCSPGPVFLEATLERSAYCCGEHIKLKCNIQNNSEEAVWVVCRLMQYVEYRINKGVLGLSKDVFHKVLEFQGPTVSPRHSSHMSDLHQHLQVPVMPPTLAEVCKVLEIYYVLKVCLKLEKSGEYLHMDFPVDIANVPFRIPNAPQPSLDYAVAAEHVEGGLYISPEFQLGQVYDGTCESPDREVVLFKPIYPCVHPQTDIVALSHTNSSQDIGLEHESFMDLETTALHPEKCTSV